MKVGDVMSREPLYVDEGTFVTKARQMIRDNHVRGLPVLNSNGQVIGIVTNQDMLRITSSRSNVTVAGFTVEVPLATPDQSLFDAAKIMVRERSSMMPVVASAEDLRLRGVVSLLDVFSNLDMEKIPSRRIGELMSTDVVTTSPDEPVSRVWDKMLESDFTGIPVLDGDKPIGMITRFDILKRGWARLSNEDRSKSKDTARLKVEKLMSTPMFSIRSDDALRDAIEMMIKRDIGRISVVDGGKLVGIVDRNDLIKAVIGEA
jgi:CBS domain-containing protein